MISTFAFMRGSHPTSRQYKKYKRFIDLKSLLKKEESVTFYGVILLRKFIKNGCQIKTECVRIFMESHSQNNSWIRTS